MKKSSVVALVIAPVVLCGFSLPSAATAVTPLSSEAQASIRAATFEVVLKKPREDSLSYEKPLPLELIPYQERNDRYISVGTAFAIEAGRFVSAAHVLAAGLRTQFGAPALRDSAGKVYDIDQILKYSGHEDFVVFSVKNAPAGHTFNFKTGEQAVVPETPPTAVPLEVSTEPVLNQKVYAVGNAYGEGVVIRDGLYTSDTPEQQDGRWKWLRFSAAASPGNSGGPLLDQEGRVIGVVLRKSESENLNYALRIAQVLEAPDNLARFDTRMRYYLPNTRLTESRSLNWEFGLPLGFPQFDRRLTGQLDDYSNAMLQDLLKNNAGRMFPRGEGSAQLLQTLYTTAFPWLIAEQADGNWDAFYPEGTANADLKKNGFVTHGTLGGYTLVRVRRPDDVSAAALYADSKLYADWILQAIAINRGIGPEQIRITSLGGTREEYTHLDTWGRKWQVRLWPIEYNDTMAISFALPTPEGYIAMLRTSAYRGAPDIQAEMKVLADFIYVSYAGTLAQWREFLDANGEHLPAAFKDIQIGFDYDKRFHYRSRRIAVECTPGLQQITPESYLTLSFAFFQDGEQAVWDVGAVSLLENQHDQTMLLVQRRAKPGESLPDSLRSDWAKLTAARYPYDATPIVDKGTTVVNALYGQPDAAAEVVYAVSYVAEGEQAREKMSTTLDTLVKGVTVRE
jgi:S1-C subfamily serine protease